MLRCLGLGLRPSDLHELDYGIVKDMLIERGNDDETYQYVATQDDFDRF
jgi:hypothetical protein